MLGYLIYQWRLKQYMNTEIRSIMSQARRPRAPRPAARALPPACWWRGEWSAERPPCALRRGCSFVRPPPPQYMPLERPGGMGQDMGSYEPPSQA